LLSALAWGINLWKEQLGMRMGYMRWGQPWALPWELKESLWAAEVVQVSPLYAEMEVGMGPSVGGLNSI
jgi:hypothetical protein